MKCPIHLGEELNSETGECALCATNLPAAAQSSEPDSGAPASALEPTKDGDLENPEPDALTDRSAASAGPAVFPLITRAERESRAGAGPGTGETVEEDASSKETEEAGFFAELARIKQQNLFAILFFGFRTAGKTWLLDRIKRELFYGEAINCQPPYEPIKNERGKDLPSSSKIELHRVFTSPKAFVLIDIPGESAEDLMEGKFDDLRMLLAAMDYASAMIVALPSEIVFFGDLLPNSDEALLAPALQKGNRTAAGKIPRKLRKWTEDLRTLNTRLEQFATGLFRAVSILSFLRHERIDASDKAAFAKVNLASIIDHMTGNSTRRGLGGQPGLDYPTFFALTKSDLVLSLLFNDTNPIFQSRNVEIRKRAEGIVFGHLAAIAKMKDERNQEYLFDPWEIVRRVRPALHNQLTAAFPLGKFDYVTAFYGHDGSTTLAPDHYERHPQRGVLQVLDWIEEAQRLGGRARWRRTPYFLAARARRYLAGMRSRRNFKFVRRDAP